MTLTDLINQRLEDLDLSKSGFYKLLVAEGVDVTEAAVYAWRTSTIVGDAHRLAVAKVLQLELDAVQRAATHQARQRLEKRTADEVAA